MARLECVGCAIRARNREGPFPVSARTPKRAGRDRCAAAPAVLEPLEQRLLLSGHPIISELMAQNNTVLRNSEGRYRDWIEIHNPTDSAIDLDGWRLAYDNFEDDRQEWSFPGVELGAGEYLVVYASGLGSLTPEPIPGEYHTGFKLRVSGAYLALLEPGGTVVHEYASTVIPGGSLSEVGYPAQFGDISYGVVPAVEAEALVPAGAPAGYLVPNSAGDAPPEGWTSVGFDDAGWQGGATGLGLDLPGLAVWTYAAFEGLGDFSEAEHVLANPASDALVVAAGNSEVLNFRNVRGGGHYALDVPFPGLSFGPDIDDFVVRAVGTVTIPAPGQWTFGINADGEFKLRIGEVQAFPHGAEDEALKLFTFPEAGEHELELVYWENQNTADLELFAAQGSQTAFDETAFRLVGDEARGGLAVRAPLVDPAPPLAVPSADVIQTDLRGEMVGADGSVYLRVPFLVDDPGDVASLALKMTYSDGYVAYLNGAEIARRNAPASPQWDSLATATRSRAEAVFAETVDVSEHVGLLQAGANVLAVHALNDAPDDEVFFVVPELVEPLATVRQERFFPIPTPGQPNRTQFATERVALGSGRAGSVSFTDVDGDRVTVTLSGPGQGEMALLRGERTGIASIHLEDTTKRSSLAIAVKKALGGDGRTELGDVVVTGPLKKFAAEAANLLGDVTVDGPLRTLTLGDLLGFARNRLNVNAGAEPVGPREKLDLTFDCVADADLDTHGLAINTLVATEWLDQRSDLRAPSIKRLVILGRGTKGRPGRVRGDFETSLHLSGENVLPGKFVLGTAVIGQVARVSEWYVGGAIGLIDCDGTRGSWALQADGPVVRLEARDYLHGDLTAEWFGTIVTRSTREAAHGTITATGADSRGLSIGALVAGEVADLVIDVPAGIGTIFVTEWRERFDELGGAHVGSITADSLGKLITTGGLAADPEPLDDTGPEKLAGDFLADLTLAGLLLPPRKPVLGSAAVAGTIRNRPWDIDGEGGAGAIRAGSAADEWSLDVEGHVKLVEARTDLEGDLRAQWFGKISAKGALPATVTATGTDETGRTSIRTLAGGSVQDTSVDAPGGIQAVSVVEWLDGGGAGDTIRADWIGKITAKGRKANLKKNIAASAGDFQASLELAGTKVAPGKPALGSARIAGSVAQTTWQIGGAVGAIRIGGDVDGWTASAGLLKSLTAGEVHSADVTVGDALGSVKALCWQEGTLTADSLKSLKLTGRGAKPRWGLDAVDGDFGADVTLRGGDDPPARVLGSARIAGDLDGGTWRVRGDVGSLTVGTWATDCTVLAGGDLLGLTLGGTRGSTFAAGVDLDTLTYDPEGSIGSVAVRGWKGAEDEALGQGSRFYAGRMGRVSLMNRQDDDGYQLYLLGDADHWQVRSVSYRDTRAPERWTWRPGHDWPGPAGTEPRALP